MNQIYIVLLDIKSQLGDCKDWLVLQQKRYLSLLIIHLFLPIFYSYNLFVKLLTKIKNFFCLPANYLTQNKCKIRIIFDNFTNFKLYISDINIKKSLKLNYVNSSFVNKNFIIYFLFQMLMCYKLFSISTMIKIYQI